MSSIWLTDGCTLKTYSASTKGAKSLVKIEIEVSEPYALASLLRELGELDAEQKAAKRPPTKAPRAKKELLALPAPNLQLPYFGDDGDDPHVCTHRS